MRDIQQIVIPPPIDMSAIQCTSMHTQNIDGMGLFLNDAPIVPSQQVGKLNPGFETIPGSVGTTQGSRIGKAPVGKIFPIDRVTLHFNESSGTSFILNRGAVVMANPSTAHPNRCAIYRDGGVYPTNILAELVARGVNPHDQLRPYILASTYTQYANANKSTVPISVAVAGQCTIQMKSRLLTGPLLYTEPILGTAPIGVKMTMRPDGNKFRCVLQPMSMIGPGGQDPNVFGPIAMCDDDWDPAYRTATLRAIAY
jgi:hypothetical protein